MTMRKTLVLATTITLGVAGAVFAQQPAAAAQGAAKAKSALTVHQTQPKGVAAAAKVAISADSARALVRMHDPKATILSEKLRRRNGKMVYDVRVREQGQKGVHWLRVDATTGTVTDVSMAGSAKTAGKRS
jgi:uncharacterized membrane protein YkoI